MSAALAQVEQVAARMFYNVSVQSAFALEDPNVRFVAEFQHKEGIGKKGAAKFEDVERQVYTTDLDEGRVALEVKPVNGPALSKVIMWRGDAEKVVNAVLEACKSAENFTLDEMEALGPVAGRVIPDGAMNRLVRLIIDPKFNTAHDVAALFAWGTSSDKDDPTLELMAWPITKNADFKR